MITKDEREYIKANLKWKFKWFDLTFLRYFILILPLGITFVASSMFYGGIKYSHIYFNNFINEFFFTALIGLFSGLFLTYFVFRRIEEERKFKPLRLSNSVSIDELAEKIQSIQWCITSKNYELIQANTNISMFSWGECVTIIQVDNNTILINSQPIGMQFFTFNRDSINFKKLKGLLT